MRDNMNTGGERRITILGSGIAGLTAGINLSLAGFHVDIYEKRSSVGLQSKGDFQGLENWTSPKDVLSFLSEINIPPEFEYEPFKECYHYDHNLKKHTIKSTNVGFYLIRRGPMEGTLDHYLEKLAREVGVIIHPSTAHEITAPDIIATGYKEPFMVAKGVNFETDLEKLAVGIFDDQVVPYGYAYLLGSRGKGTIAVVSKAGIKDIGSCLERAVDKCRKIATFQMNDVTYFGGAGTRFRKLSTGTPRVGEAAGFQDAMWGFGLRMAFHSGYLAAKSIIDGQDYWKLVNKEIVPLCKSSIVNRMFYDLLKTRRYANIMSGLASAADPVTRTNQLYAPIPLKLMLYPLANILVG
jgi:flavin-dependent dehydrogenase